MLFVDPTAGQLLLGFVFAAVAAALSLASFVLLARRMKDARPDAKHPVKSGINPQGDACILLGIFPDFIGPEANYLPVTHSQQPEPTKIAQASNIGPPGPGTNRRFPPVAEIESAVRSTERE